VTAVVSDAHLRDMYREAGFVRCPGALDDATVTGLRDAIEVVAASDPGENPLSLDAMRFESNLFRRSEDVRRFLCSPEVLRLIRPLVGGAAWVRWDQAVWKGPGAPTFPWHQDNGYTGLDIEHLQVWVALTPSSVENGGLIVSPGGHRTPLAHTWVGHHVRIDSPPEATAVRADPGDVVLFSSMLPHSTGPNVTDETRLAYVAEYLPVSGADRNVETPHFVAFRDDRPWGRFEDLRGVWSSPRG
jgi:ectoine hydroxylase-related dioxygenase (phytanoyl-CoA dioxygenase family)